MQRLSERAEMCVRLLTDVLNEVLPFTLRERDLLREIETLSDDVVLSLDSILKRFPSDLGALSENPYLQGVIADAVCVAHHCPLPLPSLPLPLVVAVAVSHYRYSRWGSGVPNDNPKKVRSAVVVRGRVRCLSCSCVLFVVFAKAI